MTDGSKFYDAQPGSKTVAWQETHGYVRMGRQSNVTMYYGMINWKATVKPGNLAMQDIQGRAELTPAGQPERSLDLGDYDDLGEVIKLLQALRSKLAYPGGKPTKPEELESNARQEKTHIKIPLPGEKIGAHQDTVLASIWLDDEVDQPTALLLTLSPAPPYYRVRDERWNGHKWSATHITPHVNIVEAIEEYKSRGGDY